MVHCKQASDESSINAKLMEKTERKHHKAADYEAEKHSGNPMSSETTEGMHTAALKTSFPSECVCHLFVWSPNQHVSHVFSSYLKYDQKNTIIKKDVVFKSMCKSCSQLVIMAVFFSSN